MSLNKIDKTRASRTEDELLALVEAVYTSPPATQETNWLEWKSSLDLSTPEGRFAVAKAILGFANRAVEQAQPACEGVAYMIVGVEPGAASGVPNFDHATLGQKIKTYADGPRWTPHYVEFSGVTVLVVVVEAPRPGDPIHALQKEFSNDKTRHQAGTVFHRGAAHTQPAGPKEIAMLTERAVQGARQPDLDLELVADADPLTRLNADREQIEDWLRRHEAHVRANSGKPPPPPPPPPPKPQSPYSHIAGLSSLSSSIGVGAIGSMFRDQYAKPEDAEEFERRVKRHLAQFRKGLVGHLLRGIVRSDENKVTFAVGNETDDSVTGVKLTVIIPRSGLLVYGLPPSVDPLPRRMPKWPNATDDWLANVAASAHANPLDYDFDPMAPSVVEKDYSFEATWDIGDLRPGEWSDSRSLTIIAGASAPDELEVELVARSMNRRRTATSKATLAISSDIWTVHDWLDPEPGK